MKNEPKNGKKPNLLTCYTFNNFVVGDNNNFALAFARAVSESPGKEYNPLFVYSTVGLGKTHLINAIGNEIARKAPSKKVLYISSHQFEAELVDAIQFGKIEDFRKRYLDLDVLLLDDVQFIAFKEAAQQEFFHAFNHLFNNGKQIVITSDRPPSTLQTLEQRIRSRFEGGIITEILQPDIETRKAILNKKLEAKGTTISPEVVDYLCENIRDDIRMLEGALKETLAFAQLTKTSVSLDIAKQVIKQKFAQGEIQEKEERTNKTMSLKNQPSDTIAVPVPPVKKDDTTAKHSTNKDESKGLKINVTLPPNPKKKDSLIKQATKEISIQDGDEILNKEKLFPGESSTTQVFSSLEKNVQPKKENDHQDEEPETSKDKYAGEMEKVIEADSISLTSVFATNSLRANVDQSAREPALSGVASSANAAKNNAGSDNDKKSSGGDSPGNNQSGDDTGSEAPPKLSLTNIFSSRDIKEKINKIIAVGGDEENEGEEDDIIGGSVSTFSEGKNVFSKEHKKKLAYELKQFDTILQKINKGKINIYMVESLDDFTSNLELAHVANKEGNYQEGLDRIKDVKKAFMEMTVTEEGETVNIDALAGTDIVSRFLNPKIIIPVGLAIIAVIGFIIIKFILMS